MNSRPCEKDGERGLWKRRSEDSEYSLPVYLDRVIGRRRGSEGHRAQSGSFVLFLSVSTGQLTMSETYVASRECDVSALRPRPVGLAVTSLHVMSPIVSACPERACPCSCDHSLVCHWPPCRGAPYKLVATDAYVCMPLYNAICTCTCTSSILVKYEVLGHVYVFDSCMCTFTSSLRPHPVTALDSTNNSVLGANLYSACMV